MSVSKDLRLQPRAKEDILEIWGYTCSEWDEEQADRYTSRLMHDLKRLASFPLAGKPCRGLGKGLRWYLCGKHVAYYRVLEDCVLIERILHPRMDPELNL